MNETDQAVDKCLECYGHSTKYRLTMQLAACIRRAYEGPRGGGLRDHVSKDDPHNEYYWHTREACLVKARELDIFFPDVIGQFKHVTDTMGKGKIEGFPRSSGTRSCILTYWYPK